MLSGERPGHIVCCYVGIWQSIYPNTLYVLLSGERSGHRVSPAAGHPWGPGRPDPWQTGGDGAELGPAEKQGLFIPPSFTANIHMQHAS